MLRLTCLVLFFIGLSNAGIAKPNTSNLLLRKPEKVSNINSDVEEFINLLPKRQIQGIFRAYVQKDKEVQANWDYIHSNAFQKLLNNVAISPEYLTVHLELTKIGLNVSKVLEMLEALFIWDSQSLRPLKISVGLRGMLMDDIRPLFPMPKFKLLSTQKFIFSSQFRKMMTLIATKSFKQKMNLLVKSRAVRSLEDQASSHGVNVEAVYEFVASFKVVYSYLMDVTLS